MKTTMTTTTSMTMMMMMNEWMDGWIGGWMDGRMDGWMNEWMEMLLKHGNDMAAEAVVVVVDFNFLNVAVVAPTVAMTTGLCPSTVSNS